MVKSVEVANKKWPEWDRETVKVEIALDSDESGVTISVSLEDEPVAELRAKVEGTALIISELNVASQINIKKKIGFFSRKVAVTGLGRGYGTMLIKALVAFARNRGYKNIVGGLTEEDLKKNRYALEWYSHRGFIVARQPSPLVPGSTASMQMLI